MKVEQTKRDYVGMTITYPITSFDEIVHHNDGDGNAKYACFICGKSMDKGESFICISRRLEKVIDKESSRGVIEAMATGTPVVAWRAAGPATTIIDGRTGFLAKPYDFKDFQIKIIRLLTNQKLNEKMGRAAWQHVKDHYSYQAHHQLLAETLIAAFDEKNKI